MTQSNVTNRQFTFPTPLHLCNTSTSRYHVTIVKMTTPFSMQRAGENPLAFNIDEVLVTIDDDVICLQTHALGKFTMRVPDEVKALRADRNMYTAVSIGYSCVKLSYLGKPDTEELIVEYDGEVVSKNYQPPATNSFPQPSPREWMPATGVNQHPFNYDCYASLDFEMTGKKQWLPPSPQMPSPAGLWHTPVPTNEDNSHWSTLEPIGDVPFALLPQSVFLTETNQRWTLIVRGCMIRMVKTEVNKPTLVYAVTANVYDNINTGMLEVVLSAVLPPTADCSANFEVNTQSVVFQHPRSQVKQLTMCGIGDTVVVMGVFNSETSPGGLTVEEHRVGMGLKNADLYMMDKASLINLVLKMRSEQDKA